MSNKFCILLTATIDPGNTPKVSRSDISSRELDYFKALEFYIDLGLPIIFCENSNYESQKINNLIVKTDNIEYLKFKSQLSHLGKSHGEKEIFDYVYNNSNILKHNDYVIKVTGRLIVDNLISIQRKIENIKYLLYVNLVRDLSCTDSRFFIFHKSFYEKYFHVSLNNHLNEPVGDGFEICLARAYHLAMADGKRCSLLPEYPQYIGFNAWNNRPLNRGLYIRIKYKIFYFLKLFVLKQTI
jgi:hypothetical protein